MEAPMMTDRAKTLCACFNFLLSRQPKITRNNYVKYVRTTETGEERQYLTAIILQTVGNAKN
jgi:hypothetical protein